MRITVSRVGTTVIRRSMLVLALPITPAGGQTLLERTPNVSSGWVGRAGVLHFNFLHRFTRGSAPARKVTSSPTFLLAASLPGRALVGLNYSTNSNVAAGIPNEWEVFTRVAPLAQSRRWPVDAALQLGYNAAARSADGELNLTRTAGPFTISAAARLFSDAFALGDLRSAIAGGAVLRLGRYAGLAGDLATMFDKPPGYEDAWSAALQLAIPHTPHTLSLQVTNTSTGTLQGASASRDGEIRYGFEFTIPVTLRRYLPRPVAPAPARRSVPDDAAAATAADTLRTDIRQIAYAAPRIEIEAGTTVEWLNRDPIDHTVTADDGGWDSGVIAPGARWTRRFDEPGTYPFHCSPHPFMQGVVVVR